MNFFRFFTNPKIYFFIPIIKSKCRFSNQEWIKRQLRKLIHYCHKVKKFILLNFIGHWTHRVYFNSNSIINSFK